MIITAITSTIMYLVLILAFLWAFTAPRSGKMGDEEYVSIDDLLEDEDATTER